VGSMSEIDCLRAIGRCVSVGHTQCGKLGTHTTLRNRDGEFFSLFYKKTLFLLDLFGKLSDNVHVEKIKE